MIHLHLATSRHVAQKTPHTLVSCHCLSLRFSLHSMIFILHMFFLLPPSFATFALVLPSSFSLQVSMLSVTFSSSSFLQVFMSPFAFPVHVSATPQSLSSPFISIFPMTVYRLRLILPLSLSMSVCCNTTWLVTLP